MMIFMIFNYLKYIFSDYDSVHTIVGMVLTIWYMILTITGGDDGYQYDKT